MIPANEFHLALMIVIAHITESERTDKLNVNHVYFDFQADNKLRIAGTDVHRLAAVVLDVSHGQPESSFVISLDSAKRLASVITASISGRLTIVPFGTDIMFTDGVFCETCSGVPSGHVDSGALSRILSGKPVDGATGELRMNPQYIMEAIAMCSQVMNPENPCVRVHVKNFTPLFLCPEIYLGLQSIESVTVVIMYKAGISQ